MVTKTTFSTTDLDFNGIKSSLKKYLAAKTEYADYNFEASGLSNILDVLAYNTHLNGLMANFALNESFLSTSQLRSSAISHAQTLGYNVRSKTASKAYVNLSVNLASAQGVPVSVTLPKGTKFSSSVDGTAYTFITNNEYYANNDGTGNYIFTTPTGSIDIPLYEGAIKTKTFIVGESAERQLYVIPDISMDTSTSIVSVFDSFGSTSYESYIPLNTSIQINSTSRNYTINETANGYFEIGFGDGITYGKKPTTGNKIVVEFISSSGPDANGAASFSPVSGITVNSVSYPLVVAISSPSAGGAIHETIDSIKTNAPSAFASQRRLVTAGDYKSAILSKFASITDVSVWGGQDNDPVNYGFVYASLLFAPGVSVQAKTAVKADIKTELTDKLSMMSLNIAFTEPETSYLELKTTFYFNPDISTTTRSSMEAQVFSKIQEYADINLKTFNGTFRKSNLMTNIDAVSDAILSTKIDVGLQQRLVPVNAATSLNNSQSSSYVISFPVQIKTPDDVNYVVESGQFSHSSKNASVKNKLNSTTLQIISVDGEVLVDNVGHYTPSTGKINLAGFSPGVISGGLPYISFSVIPTNQSIIKPLKNFIIDLDTNKSYATSVIDRETTKVII